MMCMYVLPGDKVFRAGGYCGRKFQVDITNTPISGPISDGGDNYRHYKFICIWCLRWIKHEPFSLERRTAYKELVREHSETPHIGCVVVLARLHHFRG